ncbi:MAG TPA: SHOCT domain-containing protein [Micromonosporaceae bacterium]|nr:SHOCT domain-containing protein [Micromonosporaceae bacterium]
MYWGNHGMNGWGFVVMTLNMLLFWGVLAGGGYLLYRWLRREEGSSAGSTARRLLAERYARGEIDDDEYRHRLSTLGPR